MRKTLLVLCASMLASLTIDAQTLAPIPNNYLKEYSSLRTAAPSKIALEQGEKIMGFYTTDHLPKSAVGFGKLGEYEVGAAFPLDVIGSFATGQITKVRFALGEPFGTSTLSIHEMNDKDQITATAYSSKQIETKAGWNEVTLETPVTIKENTRYFITFIYKEIKSEQASILTDGDVNPNGGRDGGLWAKLENKWYKQPTDFGNLALQVVVKGGKFIDYDLAINKLCTNSWIKKGDKVEFTFNLQNRGNKTPNNYEFAATINGKPVETTITNPTSLQLNQDVTGTLTIPTTIEGTTHKFELSVATINGTKPDKNINDDITSTEFRTYNKSLERQMTVIEQLTSQYCGACPVGSQILGDVSAMRSDIAVVAIHLDMGYNGRDQFTIEAGNHMAGALSCGFLPSIAINRHYINDPAINKQSSISIHPVVGEANNWEEAAANLSALIDDIKQNATPAFASVNISTTYDEATRKLGITVSGDATDDAKVFYGENTTLTVVLTEDNLVAKQANGQQFDRKYTHNNVLRAAVTAPDGNAINWTSNTSYSNTFETTLDGQWNPSNMSVVAYITPSFNKITNIKNLSVSNANKTPVLGAAGISQSVIDPNATEVARFTIDGRQISEPVKGINIIKMSDGTIVKEFVK